MRGRTFIAVLLAVLSVATCQASPAAVSKGEKISYCVSPAGNAEYEDLGLVDYRGRTCWLVTFRTSLTGFNDLEKIYADPDTGMPLVVEREVRWPLNRESLVEEYDSLNNSLVVKKFQNNRISDEYKFTSSGPYHNAILLPFYLRRVNDLKIGWSMVVRLREEYVVTLVGIDDIKVNNTRISAYHFTSKPDKFEIWVSRDDERLPVLIKGTVGCSLSMLRHTSAD